jgi:hypothetical protein
MPHSPATVTRTESTMAHIKKLALTALARPVRRKGHPVMVKMFKTRPEAEQWASEQERAIRLAGLPLPVDDLKKHIFGDLVRRYLKEITPTKGCRVNESAVLNEFLRHELCSKAAAQAHHRGA